MNELKKQPTDDEIEKAYRIILHACYQSCHPYLEGTLIDESLKVLAHVRHEDRMYENAQKWIKEYLEQLSKSK